MVRLLLLIILTATLSAQDFERDVRPIFLRHCQKCHNDKTRSSGLSLSSKVALSEGGNRGPGFEWLLKAVRQDGPLKMPPAGKLSPTEIAKLELWVAEGAPWRESEPAIAKTKEERRNHWAFKAPVRHSLPAVTASKWVRTPIDQFILARLEREKLKPSPEADRLTLLRRVHLDLTGILPTPVEAQDFLNDITPNAYEKQVDRLLSSPQYGERWARHWLDQARYADSDGGSRDEPRQIWKYREYVIDSLNRDLPFDQFVIEQIAGDLIPKATPSQIIATGFQRNSLLQIEAGTDREQYRSEAVADRVDTLGVVLLGLSTGCARCHDHKYDPISQREYYQLYAYFNNIEEYGSDLPPFAITNDRETTHAPMFALGTPEETEKYNALRAQLLALYKERFVYRGGEANELPKGDVGDKIRGDTIAALKKQIPPLTVAMVMRERPETRDTNVLLGGDYLRKGVRVTPGVLSAISPSVGSEATRLNLAHWIATSQNPLFARVAVNRIWQRYFGLGIVETDNDFGTQGDKPTHPELLDWLATEFARVGWSQKAMHRLIVTSSVYRQSSNMPPEAVSKDPRNVLLSRQARLRLDAEIVRDSALTASGLLNTTIGGPSVYPLQPEGVMETGQVKQAWPTSKGDDRYRRGLYTFHYRITPNPSMKVFDAANGLLPCTRRPRTNTPLQALTLLNDPTFHEMAQALARRVQNAADPIEEAMQLTLSRPPTSGERERLQRLYSVELDAFETKPEEAIAMGGKDATPKLAAWTSVARVLMNTDEFITRE